MPCSRTTFVSCVLALRVSSTLIASDETCVQADQRLAPLAAAATRPTGEPIPLAKRYCPSQPPLRWGCQSIAAEVKVSTTCSRPWTRTGTAPGASALEGKPFFVTGLVRSRPRASVLTSLRYVFPDASLSAYASAGRAAASSARPAGPNEAPLRGRATTRSFPPRPASASQEPSSASSRTLVRPCPSTTSPAMTAFPGGTRPTPENVQPEEPRLAMTTSRPERNATRGVPSGATARKPRPAVGATISARAGEGRAASARPLASPIHANLT